MNRTNFYGDDGNNVDFSSRHAGGAGGDDASDILKSLRRARPDLPIWKDAVLTKRLSDLLGDSQAGFDTTPKEDALLRQATPEADEHTERAESLVQDMERHGIRLGTGREKFVRDKADEFRGGPIRPAQPQEEKEEPFLSRAAEDKFWASGAKNVMPKRLQKGETWK